MIFQKSVMIYYKVLLSFIICSNTSNWANVTSLGHFYHFSKVFKHFKTERFCKFVDPHFFCEDIQNGNLFLLNFFSNAVPTYFNMLSFLMVFGFFVKAIAFFLSAHNLTGWLGSWNPRQAKNHATNKAFFPASTVTMYSTSVNDKITVLCSFNW